MKTTPATVEVYQLDDTALGDRKPLLMVHGLLGEYWTGFRWGKLLEHLNGNREFVLKYKVYLARYDTVAPLPSVTPSFKIALRKLAEAAGNRPITVVALSMGGNLIQEAMEDVEVERAVEKVLAMGTPFHGSPLFTCDWMRYSILKNHKFPWVRADLSAAYGLYFRRHRNLLEDLRWDNVDGCIPDVGRFSAYLPWRVSGELDPQRCENSRIFSINEELKTDKSKFITYGGYLVSAYASASRPRIVSQALSMPRRFVTTTLPLHFGREHPVLRALNAEIGALLPRNVWEKGEDKARSVSHRVVYGLNDGITPLASALFLPAESFRPTAAVAESDLPSISLLVDVRKARVFRGIDHLTFIDDYRPRGTPGLLRDELNPSASARGIFDWILTDLLTSDLPIASTGSNPDRVTD